MITDAYGAAANLVQAVMKILFLDGSYKCKKQIAFLNMSIFVDMIHDLKHKFSILMELLCEGSAQESDLASLLQRGHYTVKQLQFETDVKTQKKTLGICGQSKELLVLARHAKSKIILKVWNKVKRQVMSTLPICSYGCHGALAFVLQGELLVAMLRKQSLDSFFFFVMRCDITSDGSINITDTNSWPYPVTMREVSLSGHCKDVTFHMFTADNGNLVWVSIFEDDAGTKITFIDPASGAEIGRESINPKQATLQAIKDNKAIFLDHDKCVFVICELGRRCITTKTKLSVENLFTLPEGEEEWKYRETSSRKAAFDLSDNKCLVLVSPRGEHVILNVDSLQVQSKMKATLPSHVLEKAFSQDHYVAQGESYFDESPPIIDLGLQKHCLVNGVLFFLVRDPWEGCKGTCVLMATDLHSNMAEATAVKICAFAIDSEQSVQMNEAGHGNHTGSSSAASNGHFVPYGFVNKKSQNKFASCNNGLSYMWTLHQSGGFFYYKLHYCHFTETLFMAGAGDDNLVEVKFLREDAVGIRARQVGKQRSIQAAWKKAL